MVSTEVWKQQSATDSHRRQRLELVADAHMARGLMTCVCMIPVASTGSRLIASWVATRLS